MSALVLNVNGSERQVNAPPDESLLSVLRNYLQLTGTKYGCGEGQCGACTVLLDGRPARSCRTPVSQAVGKKITTIEGLEENGQLQFLLICFATWGADIGAYYAGRYLGKTKLAPAISPGKTVEGFAGGIISAVVFAGLFAFFFFPQANMVLIVGAGLIGGLFGPVGDLAESQIKRFFGVKDSGAILPGHGGLLDRADALMLTAPAYYVLLALAGYVS